MAGQATTSGHASHESPADACHPSRTTSISRCCDDPLNPPTTPAFRSLGLGGGVLEAAKSWAGEQDIELLIVWPSDGSVGFYRRHGFVGVEEPLVWMNPNASG